MLVAIDPTAASMRELGIKRSTGRIIIALLGNRTVQHRRCIQVGKGRRQAPGRSSHRPGTETACTDVIEPCLWFVIRSCIAPMSVLTSLITPQRKEYGPTAADISRTSWLSGKMIITKNQHVLASVRNCSAIVRPGQSNTRHVHLEGLISSDRRRRALEPFAAASLFSGFVIS